MFYGTDMNYSTWHYD